MTQGHTTNSESMGMTGSEDIKIYSTEDEKIKICGELLSNDSARKILELLFKNEHTANEISQETDISLQLVRYHLAKMQKIGIVKVSRVSKSSKSHDMNYYKATKFGIVITPPGVSKRAKESKLLKRSFKTIYKFAGIVAAGLASVVTGSILQSKNNVVGKGVTEPNTAPSSDGGYMGNVGSEPTAFEETLELARRRVEAGEANPTSGSGTPLFDVGLGDFVLSVIVMGGVMGSLALYLFVKAHRFAKAKNIQTK